jgi:hypothetical protein
MRPRTLGCVSVLAVIACSCSSRTLDRAQAGPLIANLQRFKTTAFFSIQIESPFLRETIPLSCMTQAEVERHPVNVQIVKLGWVRYESRLTSIGYHKEADCPVMVLTDAGKAASAAWQSRPAPLEKGTVWTIPIGDRPLSEVTGLTDAPDGSKTVEFVWKWKPNQLGDTLQSSVEQARAFFQRPRKGTADCRLWDDGWRCTLTSTNTSFEDVGQFSVPYQL